MRGLRHDRNCARAEHESRVWWKEIARIYAVKLSGIRLPKVVKKEVLKPLYMCPVKLGDDGGSY
jgi:hypothetical protein